MTVVLFRTWHRSDSNSESLGFTVNVQSLARNRYQVEDYEHLDIVMWIQSMTVIGKEQPTGKYGPDYRNYFLVQPLRQCGSDRSLLGPCAGPHTIHRKVLRAVSFILTQDRGTIDRSSNLEIDVCLRNVFWDLLMGIALHYC